jgi:hypothetical protein
MEWGEFAHHQKVAPMKSMSRTAWFAVIASVIVAVAIVLLIPYYGITGGHTEHAGMADMSGMDHDVLMNDAGHDFIEMPNGIEVRLTTLKPDDQTIIATIRAHMQAELTRHQTGDFSDAMSPASAPIASQLAPFATDITITYRDTPVGAALQFASLKSDVVELLHQWAQAMEQDHGGMHSMP